METNEYNNRIRRFIFYALVMFYVVYAVYYGALVYAFPMEVSEEYAAGSTIAEHYEFGDKLSEDRVALIETPTDGWQARIDMIENAQESIKVSYHTAHWGETTEIFLGLLLEAADRGVEIDMIFDGVVNRIYGKNRTAIYALVDHPNIDIRFYEPLDAFNPISWNNRLHDKYIIVDGEILILGGRNMGDKYFDPDSYEGDITNDRDVLVFKTGDPTGELNESIIPTVEAYFDIIWHSEYSEEPYPNFTDKMKRKGAARSEELLQILSDHKETKPNVFARDFNWLDYTVPTKKTSLIYNPVVQGPKEPWVGYEMKQMAMASQEYVILQSPYIVPQKKMMEAFEEIHGDTGVLKLLTNSMASSPNFPAFSGYLRKRNDIAEMGLEVHEYQGPGSIHAKSMVVDGEVGIVGSFNLDPRSVYMSTETMLVIHSEPFTELLEAEMQNTMDRSLVVGPDGAYHENPAVEEVKVSPLKKGLMYLFSIFTYPVTFML